jgi:hypothetical protein
MVPPSSLGGERPETDMHSSVAPDSSRLLPLASELDARTEQMIEMLALHTHRAHALVRLAHAGHEHPRAVQAWLQSTFRLATALRLTARCDQAEEILREANETVMAMVHDTRTPFGIRVVAHESLPWVACELVEHLRAHGRLLEAQVIADQMTAASRSFGAGQTS